MRHWPSNPPEVPPMGPSKVLSGLAFTGRHARYTSADTWYPSWASDDKMYSPWTDGSVGPWSSDSHGRLAMTGRENNWFRSSQSRGRTTRNANG